MGNKTASRSHLRIAIGHAFYRQSGGENHFVHQEAELLGSRHEVHMLARHNIALDSNVRTGREMVYSSQAHAWATRALASLRPDVLHLHNIYPSIGPAFHLAAQSLRIPVVMTVHNLRMRCPNGYMYTEDGACSRCQRGNHTHAVLHQCFPNRKQGAAYALATWVHRFILKLQNKVDVFIAPSEFVARTLVDWGIPTTKVHLIRHFVQTEVAFGPPTTKGLFAGRLSAEKRLDVLLDALALAGDPPFMVAGDGPLADALKTKTRKLQLGKTEFLGHISHRRLQSLWEDLGYAVICSGAHETASLIAMEAMAAGRTIIVTRVGGLPELGERIGGEIVPVGDAEVLARALRRVTTNERARSAQGLRAREFARQELEPTTHLDGLEKAYLKAIDSGERSG
jgi:glycosyltransferase involved in cell wall biosynthesis